MQVTAGTGIFYYAMPVFFSRNRHDKDGIFTSGVIPAEVPELHTRAFDMTYAWELHHIMNQVAKGEMTVDDLYNYFIRHDSIYDPAIYRMNFITNHDENSWNGTEFERMGDGVKAFATLSFTVPGMPLIYSGQELGICPCMAL